MKLNVDNVYICHYSKLVERKQDLVSHLNINGIFDYEFVECFDKDTWDKYAIVEKYPLVFEANSEGRHLNMAEVSLTMKHVWIIEDFYKREFDSVLILEDDVKLIDGFVEKFNDYKSQLPTSWDIAWVGGAFNLHEFYVEGKNVYRNYHGSRCTHAFIISKRFVEKVIDEVKYVNDASDWYYNYLIRKMNLENYWFEPPLAKQQTKYVSAISGKKWTEDLLE